MIAVAGIAAAIFGGVGAAIVLAAVVNMSSGIGRMAFDSIVQRDAPDANQGRAFAKFETRFQLSWAVAGVIPVSLHVPRTCRVLDRGFDRSDGGRALRAISPHARAVGGRRR